VILLPRVKRVYIPNRSTKSGGRKREQKNWFRNGRKWRTGRGRRLRREADREIVPMNRVFSRVNCFGWQDDGQDVFA
jgi:hypothetical protein